MDRSAKSSTFSDLRPNAGDTTINDPRPLKLSPELSKSLV
jgi:hypothetical protein